MIGNDWDIVLDELFSSDTFLNIYEKVKEEYKNNVCYPDFKDIFRALSLTSYSNTKIILLGQDPYPSSGEADGLSFSNSVGKLPGSLKNMFLELERDLEIVNTSGDLSSWAREGVLLLNSILTVERSKTLSHKSLKWEKVTDQIILEINKKTTPVVFILLGNFAKSKEKLITNDIHLVIKYSHPSPAAQKSFIGSSVFSKANEFLIENNIEPVDFTIV